MSPLWASGDSLTPSTLNRKMSSGLSSALSSSWGWFNVRDYGAAGDGTTDDTSAIRLAVSAASAAGGGTVFASRGTYNISGIVVLPSFVEFCGEGFGTRVQTTSSTTDGIGLSGSSIIVRDVALIGYGSAQAGAHGIDGGGNAGCLIDHVHIEGWGALGINLASGSSDNVVRNCHVVNCYDEGIYVGIGSARNKIIGNSVVSCRRNGIDIVGSDNIIAHNLVKDCGSNATFTIDVNGILISALSAAGPVRGNQVIGNNVQGCRLGGINVQTGSLASSSGHVIAGNSCYSNGKISGNGDGILIDADSGGVLQDVIVQGNSCVSNERMGILVSSAAQVTVNGNVASSNGSSGLAVAGASSNSLGHFTVFQGNVARANAAWGLNIYNSNASATAALSNVLQGNTAGNYNNVGTRSVILSLNSGGVGIGTASATSAFDSAVDLVRSGVGSGSGSLAFTGTNNTGKVQYADGGAQYISLADGNDVASVRANLVAPRNVLLNGPSQATVGTAVLPAYTFQSEVSLGFFRSAASTIALSYGALAGQFSCSGFTTAVSGTTANTTDGFIRISILSLTTNGCEIAVRSGNSTYRFASVALG